MKLDAKNMEPYLPYHQPDRDRIIKEALIHELVRIYIKDINICPNCKMENYEYFLKSIRQKMSYLSSFDCIYDKIV